MKPYVMCYPQLGNYDVPISWFVRNGLKTQYMPPPRMTKKTIETGGKYAPDFVCAPFKCMLGCYIEALEAGANVMIGTGGTCRLGYYGELHEQILSDLGYDFEMFNITLANYKNIFGLLKALKHFAPDSNVFRIIRHVIPTFKMITYIDSVEDYMRRNLGYEVQDESFKRAHIRFLNRLKNAKNLSEIKRIYRETLKEMREIPLKKPEHPIRIGLVGEYFTILDPYSNHDVEAKLAKIAGLHICSMGERILRCETAPVVATTAVMYATGNLS